MDQVLERRFLALVRGCLVSLPFDLKVLFEAKDDPDFERKAREIACGAILYVLTVGDVAGEKNIIGYVDDTIIVRLALKAIGDTGGEAVAAFRDRFPEQFANLDEDLRVTKEFLGPEVYAWLAGKAENLPRQAFKLKKVVTYLDDEENAADLYEQGLTFQTDYKITEHLLEDKFKQVKPVLEHLQKRRVEESKKIS